MTPANLPPETVRRLNAVPLKVHPHLKSAMRRDLDALEELEVKIVKRLRTSVMLIILGGTNGTLVWSLWFKGAWTFPGWLWPIMMAVIVVSALMTAHGAWRDIRTMRNAKYHVRMLRQSLDLLDQIEADMKRTTAIAEKAMEDARRRGASYEDEIK